MDDAEERGTEELKKKRNNNNKKKKKREKKTIGRRELGKDHVHSFRIFGRVRLESLGP